MKRRTILSSILVIIACIAVISGTTFALFTSESSVNIAITSGKVNVVATLDNLECYSATADTNGLTADEIADEAGTITSGPFAGTYYYDKLDGITFKNGGTATIDPNQLLTLDRVTPGDKVKVRVNIENNSNVKIQYRIRVNVVEGNNAVESLKLFSGLKTKIDGIEFSDVIRVTEWKQLGIEDLNEEDNLADVPVEIYLPLEAGNEYQDLSTQIKITVEAVQSNAHTASLDAINTILANSNTKNNTMYDAIQEVITANSAYTEADFYPYVWNVDTDRFYDESSIDGNFFYKYFKAYDAIPNVQTYSIYAKAGWDDVADVTGLTVGFDAGYNTTEITSVSYNRTDATYGRDVVIRTNSSFTNLTINAPLDILYHYGDVGTASINAIAGNSYHEYGKVAFLEISKGRVALEAEAEVSNIHIVSKKEVVNEVEQTTNTFDEIVIAIDSSTTKPTFSRDDVEIAPQGTLVVAIQTGTEEITEDTKLDYLWLTKQGVYEQIKVSDTKEEAGEVWVDQLSGETVEEQQQVAKTQSAAFEIANNITRDSSNIIDVKVSVTESETTKTYQVSLDTDRNLVVVEENAVTTENPIATLNEAGVVTISETEFKVELANNSTDKSTELKVTNLDTQVVVETTKAVEQSGLTEEQITEVKNEVVTEAKIEEVSNDSKYVARIGTVGYEKFETAIAAAKSDTIVLLTNYEYTPSSDTVFVVDKNGKEFSINVVNTDEITFVVTTTVIVETKIYEYAISTFVPSARIGANGYKTLSEAIEASKDGETIVLVSDVNESNSISKNISLDLNNHKITATTNKAALTLYSLDDVTIKNGTINGQIQIGERKSTIIKWKHLNYGEDNYEAVYGYHPLAPAKNVLLKDLIVDSGNLPSLFYTNIEEDLVRGAPSNYCDNNLYGQYIYKTGYVDKDQYIQNRKDEVFTVCTDKDFVTVDGGSYTGSSFVGNMLTYDGKQIEGVLTVCEGTITTDATAGRYVESESVLVGSSSSSFVVSKTIPSNYTASINYVYYTYEGGANDAIRFARIGETVYINENADAVKEIAQGESFTVIALQEGLSWTGATVTGKVENPSNYKVVETTDKQNPLMKVYTIEYSTIARIYHVGDTRQTPNANTTYDDYGSLKAAVDAAGTGDYVMLMADTLISDENEISTNYVKYGINLSARMVLDLNGHTYTYTGSGTAVICTANTGTDGGQRAIRDTSVEKTGTIYATNGYAFAKYNQNSEKTVIYGGNFVSATTNAVWIKNANVFEIQGGRFISLNNKTPINGTPTTESTNVIKIQTTVSSQQYLSMDNDGTYEVLNLTQVDDDNYRIDVPTNKMVLLPAIIKVGFTCDWELVGNSHSIKSGFILNSSENEITLQTKWTELTEFKIELKTSNANVTIKVNGEDWDGISYVKFGDIINVSVEYIETNSQKCTIKDQNGLTYVVDSDFEMPRANITIDASSSAASCLVQGTLVTLQNGTRIPVEQIKAGDILLVFDHETGTISTSKVLFNDYEQEDDYLVLNLYFSNGKTIKIVDEHGFFDLDLMKYVYITNDNYSDYIGHIFYGLDENVTLLGGEIKEERVSLYSPVTEVTLNYFVEDLLSMPGGIEGMFNIFDYDSQLKFDEEAKQNDIDTYGLLDYEYFEEMIPYEMYVVFNGKYLGIAMAKGILTEDNLKYYIERYSKFWE